MTSVKRCHDDSSDERGSIWALAINDLKAVIEAWEVDISLFEDATGEEFLATNRRLSLQEMCPGRLRSHIRLLGPERLPDCEAIRTAISDWLCNEAPKPGRTCAAALELAG